MISTIVPALTAVQCNEDLVCRPHGMCNGWNKNAIHWNRQSSEFEVIGTGNSAFPQKAQELLGVWEVLRFDEFTKGVLSEYN